MRTVPSSVFKVTFETPLTMCLNIYIYIHILGKPYFNHFARKLNAILGAPPTFLYIYIYAHIYTYIQCTLSIMIVDTMIINPITNGHDRTYYCHYVHTSICINAKKIHAYK